MYTIECVLLAFAGVCLANNTDFRVGGLGELRDATPKTQHLVDSVNTVSSLKNYRFLFSMQKWL